jgi:putative chitinase
MELVILKKIINNNYINQDLIDSLNQTFEKFQINTPLRQSHFLSQIIHESGSFKYNREIASGQNYENRADLGNIQKGDGVKYVGRGYIQITGRSNYEMITRLLGVDFINNPELLEKNPYAMLSAGIYWENHNLNHYADLDDILTISKKINGINKNTGLPNGYDDRKKWLKICKDVFKI